MSDDVVIDREKYPNLTLLASPLPIPERTIVGREDEKLLLMAAMARPELCNALLVAAPGTGKTALVQAVAMEDKRLYLELDMSRMIYQAESSENMAALLKMFFDEADLFVRNEGRELVIFMDEFHQIIQLSNAAVEAIKPILAASGTRGIRMIAATTDEEFHKHVAPNLPLVERLQRINLDPPDQETTVEILRGMAKRYEVSDEFFDDHVFYRIVELTERYMISSVQPRKSILVLDAMVGWHRITGKDMDDALLNSVLNHSLGVNVAMSIDGSKIKQKLNEVVLAQQYATEAIAKRLQLSVADLNDKTRPEASFLFSGSTGVGKSTTCATQIPVWSQDGSVAWKAAGELEVGDRTFNRMGEPQEILDVFPQGEREVYRVTLDDGRTLDVSDNHLWAVLPAKRSRSEGYTIYSTQTLINKGLTTRSRNGKEAMKYFIPMNEAVQWPEADLPTHPYVIGALIGNGCLTVKALEFSSNDEETVSKVGRLIGAANWEKNPANYSWRFCTGQARGVSQQVNVQAADVLGEESELLDVRSSQKRIPRQYLHGSIAQRWDLVQGLFDTDGSIGQADGDRFNVSYSTIWKGLAEDVQQLLYSLGVGSSIGRSERERDGRALVEFIVRVKSCNADKQRFFSLGRKLEIAQCAAGVNKQREKTFDHVGIRSIEKLNRKEDMVCIYVDHDEHLYQAGQFVVTHNTEMSKQLAELVFGDSRRHLIRFDMTDFSESSSLDLFRQEVTRQVWSMSNAVLLFDEIEKASAQIVRLLLQILDDGELMDEHQRRVSFKNCYIVMTTNAGTSVYKDIARYASSDTGSGEVLKEYERLIRRALTSTQSDNRFPPELLGRVDQIVPFQPLSEATQKAIVRGKMHALGQEVYRKHGVTVKFDSRVLRYLTDESTETESDAGGARVAVARLTREVTAEIARFINENPGQRRIGVWAEGVMAVESKTELETNVKIVVAAIT